MSQWARQLRQHHGDTASLHARPIPGRPARLSAEPWQRVLAVLQEGALKAGFDTERWTLRRIRAVMLVAFGVRHHAHYLARRLKALGWSPQQPAVYARERDEALVQAWLAQDWPRIKTRLAGEKRQESSWMKPASHSAPTARPPGRRWGTPPSCGVSASAGHYRRPSGSRCLAASTSGTSRKPSAGRILWPPSATSSAMFLGPLS
jgi:transposase